MIESPFISIKRLPNETVNRIAAGEVVERPASVAKELAENALDAQAKHIHIFAEQSGLSRLIIEDDGIGMNEDELPICVERHATSKLTPDEFGRVDLLNIGTLGFRGEALPSIAAVSRLSILSKSKAEIDAFELAVEAGVRTEPKPAAWAGLQPHGTRIEVRDLFFATPARLKFLKSERAEATALTDTLRRLAMSRADIGFIFEHNGRKVMNHRPQSGSIQDARLKRLTEIIGTEFGENSLAIDSEREGIHVTGYAGLPTLNRGNAQHQYLFVNNRPVKDRLLAGVVRAAYQDFLARDRHPLVALFIDLDPEKVDVNVHPAKTEVRFRDSGLVRGLLIGALRHALAGAGHRASTSISGYALGRARQNAYPNPQSHKPHASIGAHKEVDFYGQNSPNTPNIDGLNGLSARVETDVGYTSVNAPPPHPFIGPDMQTDKPDALLQSALPNSSEADVDKIKFNAQYTLGVARAQLHETYIIAQSSDGIVIVDQHAAHERIVYEQMKAAMAAGEVPRQTLLIPEIVDLDAREASMILERREEFLQLGLEIESFGGSALCVRATPALFGQMDIKGLIKDLADDLSEYDEGLALKEKFEDVMGNMACRSSIRAGRRMNAEEMDSLLRHMEQTPYSGQCNHGRPTYVELKLSDIERLFGRR